MLAVCHTASGNTRAGTPRTDLSVRAARPSSSTTRAPAPWLWISSAAFLPLAFACVASSVRKTLP